MNAPVVSPLIERYTKRDGPIYLTGVQALLRILVDQRRRDRAQGLNTAGFVSGYRGSPLGTFDHQLWSARALLAEEDIHFEPGLNEDLAATAVWGSQLAALNDTRKADGVFGLWYGKGPGVDRSADALKHANAAGTSALGGVLAVAGDDHGASSSTLAHQSEQTFIAAMMPVLAPADVGEIIEYGLYGYALSRFSGTWVALKALTEVVEGAGTVTVSSSGPVIHVPAFDGAPPDGLHIRWPDNPLAMERRLLGPRMAAVHAFSAANRFDRVLISGEGPRLGIVAPGKAALDVIEALRLLGLDKMAAAARGISLYKPALIWPLTADPLRAFAASVETLLVVEEKRPVVEDQMARLLYGIPAAPRLIGKADESGAALVSQTGTLDPSQLALILGKRLLALHPGDGVVRARFDRLKALSPPSSAPVGLVRAPYFCAGCPHNISTKVPEGSRAMAGIGCHGMATWVPDRAIASMTHMGGEGMHWIGQAPFVREPHRFQNLGDGTYAHSGSLNIRAAAASGANITFKILYNDAVAMTGGQPVEGRLSVPQIAQQVVADGARQVVIVTDDPDKYAGAKGLPSDIPVRHRRDLDAVQRELREVRGLTVLIYDQMCATEKRRRRKRGSLPANDLRVVINPEVCEGCGDCHVKSSCIAIEPLETELGRKRRINQSSCNTDTSCLQGFCPSFVTLTGARPRKAATRQDALLDAVELPEPNFVLGPEPYNILIPGIGGTGVVTIAQILGMAAHLEGRFVSTLDMAGLAQKNGAVMSFLRLAAAPVPVTTRIPAGSADLVLATDLVVATAPAAFQTMARDRTTIVANTDVAPTLAFVFDGAADLGHARLLRELQQRVGTERVATTPAQGLAQATFADAIATNMILVGYAWQRGLIPLARESIEQAIALNGVAGELNRDAFLLGRIAAERPASLAFLAAPSPSTEPETTTDLVDRFANRLTAYQNAEYAQRYKDTLRPLAEAEIKRVPERDSLVRAAARSLYKLMAYKDEYEVARLQVERSFHARLAAEFEGDLRPTYHFAPPLLARLDPTTGEPRKMAFGPWIRPALTLLARMKGLRGTSFDPFGYSAERRNEHALIDQYVDVIAEIAEHLNPDNHDKAVEIATLPLEVRGFGHVKDRAIRTYREQLKVLRGEFMNGEPGRISEPVVDGARAGR